MTMMLASVLVFLSFFYSSYQTPISPGRCPPLNTIKVTPSMTLCRTNKECTKPKMCCPYTTMKSACVNAQTIGSLPIVTPLIVGSEYLNGEDIRFLGAATLVQSKGYNYLFDLSNSGTTVQLLSSLWNNSRLTYQDIDMVIMSHDHPDHFSNLQSFPESTMIFGTLVFIGTKFTSSPLAKGEKYFLNNDPNIEIVQTPGHTAQDVSMIVRNVPAYGTVSIVGDMILAKVERPDVYQQNVQLWEESRKKVACISNWIVPGHGEMFEMNAEQRKKFKCT